MRVLIQAGHEGLTEGNLGAVGPNGWTEQNWTTIVANAATTWLQDNGVTVFREDADFHDSEGNILQYSVDYAFFLHFNGSILPWENDASVGYSLDNRGGTNDAGFAQNWKNYYESKGWGFGWDDDNYSENLSQYYGYTSAVDTRSELLIEFGTMTNTAAANWLHDNLSNLGIWLAEAAFIDNYGFLPSEAPILSVPNVSTGEGENLTVSFSISEPNTRITRVYYEMTPVTAEYSDFAGMNGWVEIPVGLTGTSLSIATFSDADLDNETISLTAWVDGTDTSTTAIGTIQDSTTPPGDGNDTLATAQALTFSDRTVTDSVGGTDPDDYFRFVTSGTGTFTIDLTGLDADINLRLLDYQGNVLSTSTASGSANETITYSYSDNQLYYIRVDPHNSAQSSYSIGLDVAADTTPPPPPGDGNDILNTAQTLTFSDRLITGSVGGTDVDDYFRFVTSGTGTFTIDLTGLSADIDLRLLDYQGNVLSTSTGSGSSNETVTYSYSDNQLYYVRVDPYNSAQSSYSLGLDVTADTTPPPPPPSTDPDLQITAVSVSDTTWSDGESITVDFTVENTGGDAASSRSGIYLSTNDNFSYSDILIDFESQGTMNAGEVDPETETFTVDFAAMGIAPGTYYLGVLPDYENTVSESSEGNNDDYSDNNPIRITVVGTTTPPPTTDPDLQISAVSVSDMTWSDGESITVDFTVENTGGDAASSRSGIYLSTNDNFSYSDILIDFESQGTMNAGEVDPETETFTVDFAAMGIAPGTYYLGVLPDYENTVSESSEGNNDDYSDNNPIRITVVGQTTTNEPDIIADNFTITSASTSVLLGAALHFTWEIANIGQGDQAGSPTAGIYLSNDSNVTTSDTLLHEEGWSDLIAGTRDDNEGQLDVLLPSSIAPSTYYLAVIADNHGEVSEANEGNNVSNVQTITVLPQPTEADLFVTSAALDTATIQEGSTATISYVINNGGDTRASNSWSGIWLSTDAIFGNGDDVFLEEDIVDVDPGEADAESEYLEDLATLSAGTYYLFVETNHNGDIIESDTSNNVSGPVELTVEAPETIDLAIWSTGWNDSTLASGQIPNFGFTVANNGNTPTGNFTTQIYLSQYDQVGFGDILVGEHHISGLMGGEESTRIAANISLPYAVAQGDYYFLVVIDSEGSISETDETNNIFFSGDGIWNPIPVTSERDVHTIGTIENDILHGGGADLLEGVAGSDTIILTGDTYHTSGYVAFNVSSDTQVGTQTRINLEGLVRIEAVTDGGADADIVQLSGEADAFFLHDAYSGFHSSVTLTEDYVGNESAARFANIEEIRGMGGDDIIDLTSPNYSLAGVAMSIDGGEGNDVIWGSDANEIISGGNGNDTIFGGIGTDLITGGAGADVFEFTLTSTNTSVTDFDVSEGDTLRFYNAGGVVFDASSVALTATGIQISYTDTASGIDHSLSISLAQSAADFSATLAEIQNALEFI